MGGMLLGYKKDLTYKIAFKEINNYPIFTINNESNSEVINFIPVYLNCTSGWERDFSILEKVLEDSSIKNNILIGDFNSRTGKEQSIEENFFNVSQNVWGERESCDNKLNVNGRKILEFCEDRNLVILNGRTVGDIEGNFTYMSRNGCSVIDYVICPMELVKYTEHLNVLSSVYSDHCALDFKIKLNVELSEKERKLLPKLNWNKNVTVLNNLKIDQILEGGDFGYASIVDLKQVISSVYSSKKSSKLKWKKIEKWYDGECYRMREKSFELLNVYRDLRKRQSRNEDDAEEAFRRYKSANNAYIKRCSDKKKAYYEDVGKKLVAIRNTSDWWKWSKELSTKEVLCSDGSMCVLKLVDQFQTLLNNNQGINYSFCTPLVYDEFLDGEFSFGEIEEALKMIKDNKAAGEDRIPAECFKYASEKMKLFLCSYFNKVYSGEEEMYPNKSIIIALYKKGDRSVASNYRGISIGNADSKIFGRVVYNRLNTWVQNRNMLSEMQAGFRSGYSTCDNIFNLTQIINQCWESGKKKIYCFFVDFRAAFDRVSRNALFYKLYQLGISTKFCGVLQKMYFNTQNEVWYDGKLSDPFPSTCGLKQGCVSSPLLFSLYINDLPNVIGGGVKVGNNIVNMLMYADDLVLLAERPRQLQLMINKLFEFCTNWSLEVNMTKSQIMIMKQGGGRKCSDEYWNYGGVNIDVVYEYKYLGILLTPSLNLSKHYKQKHSTSKYKVFSQWRNFVLNPQVDLKSKINLLNAVGRSTVCYSSEVFGYKYQEEVDIGNRFFVKKLFGLPSSTPNFLITIECGILPTHLFALKLHMKYIVKVLFKYSSDRLPRTLLINAIGTENEMWKFWKYLGNKIEISWDLSETEDIWMAKVNKVMAWYEKDIVSSAIALARASSEGIYSELILANGRSYFNCGLSFESVKLILKVRCNQLMLNDKPWREEDRKKCSLCNLGERENIQHFMGRCPILKAIRKLSLGSVELDSEEILKWLNGENWKLLLSFLNASIRYRKLLIYEFNY